MWIFEDINMIVSTDNLTAQPPAPAGIPSAEERQWGMFAHLSALSAFISGIGFIVGPIVVWQVKKNEMPFVDDQGKEAVNFAITLLIAYVALWMFTLVTLGIGLVISIPAFFVVSIAWLVFTVIAAIKANEGVAYRYPVCLRLVK